MSDVSDPVATLELIGQGVLPALIASAGVLSLERPAREIWAARARQSRSAAWREDLEAVLLLTPSDLAQAVTDVVRRLLPGRNDPGRAVLGRYLAALPALWRRQWMRDPANADDLSQLLPPRILQFQTGDTPAACGDRALVEPVHVGPTVECWLAQNPHLPARSPMLLVFFPDRAHPPEALVAWHRRLGCSPIPGLVALEDTFLTAPVPNLRFALPGTDPLVAGLRQSDAARLQLFRRLVDTVVALHRLSPPVCLGPLHPSCVFLAEDRPCVLALGEGTNNPRHDLAELGRVGHVLVGQHSEPVRALLGECRESDPLLRPADAPTLLKRLEPLLSKESPAPTAAPPPAPQRPRTRSGEVWKVLDDLRKTAPEQPKSITNSVGLRLVLAPAGTFRMGSPSTEHGRRDNEGPVHEVVFPHTFYLGVFPVTQGNYERIMGSNPSRFQGSAGGGPEHPVESVSYDDAMAFCRRLSERPEEVAAGRSYRLPTEAEWEYACRAAGEGPFHFGASLSSQQAAIDGHHPYGDAPRGPSLGRTCRVGTFPANAWGLHDMHGNVWEWCSDWFDADYYRNSPRQNPTGPANGLYRVLRGGSWRNQAVTCRSAYRNALTPNQKQPFIGFRVVLVVPKV